VKAEEHWVTADDDPLASASTVVILVHGVGDHNQVDIIGAAEKVLGEIWATGTAVVEVPGLVSDAPVNAVRIDADGRSAYVFAMVWSRRRQRLVEGIEAYSSIAPLSFVWDSLPAFGEMVLNLFSSIGAARGWRRLALLLAALVGSALLAGLVWASVYVFSWHVGAVWELWHQWGYTPALLVFIFLIPFALGVVWRLSTARLDIVADIATYIGSARYRKAQLGEVRAMLGSVFARALQANVVVVGHSLGSVMVMNGLADLPEALNGTQRLLLVTVGSPFLRLARWFSAVVHTPEQLAAVYEEGKCIRHWVNFWRDQDGLGGPMKVRREWFAEASLGEGAHGAYWSDERPWARVITLVQAPRASLLSHAGEWRWGRDSHGRTQECYRAIVHVAYM
jgi:hypothetical protein